tara:strand:- start:1455 stop:3683 length:2229 start_codon:yes stop_codon:yes gene_type:complete
MKKYIFSSLFMMNFLIVCCQTQGVVYSSDNTVIENASIFLTDQKILLNTNKDGIFSTNIDIPNNSIIRFYKHGYASKIISYQKGGRLKVVLEKLHISLDEIGVSETFSELGNSKLTNIEKKSLNDVFLKSISMIDNITELSGVDAVSSGLGIQKIVVRGLSGMRVVTFLNGIKINNQQWANDHGIGFTDLGLGEVELIKGSSALKYGGESIGGLLYFKDVPFISSKKLKGFFATKFNANSYLSSSQFGVKWNKNNFYINLYGQYSISSDYKLPNNNYLFNSRFQQNAIKFSIAHRYKKWQNIFRYHLHTEDTGIPAHVHGDPETVDLLEVTSSSIKLLDDFKPTRPTQFINNQLFIYESSYINDNLKLSLNAGHFINNLMEYEKWTSPAFDLTITQTQIRPNIRYTHKNITFNLGSSVSVLDNINGEGSEKLVPDASSLNIGPYVILDYEKNNIGFNSGIRYDYKKLTSEDNMLNNSYNNKFTSTSFSSGAYYKYKDHIFRATYSGAFRAPHISELFSNGVHHGTNRYEIGNVDLDIEYANQLDCKYQWSNEHLGLVINPFIQHISNFISINPADSFISGNRVYNYIQYDEVIMRGIEMNLHYHPHKLHALHFEQSYSFLQTINKNSSYGLALTPANSIKTKVIFDFSEYEKISKYRFDYISLYHIYKFEQDNFAEYEELTQSYNIFNLHIGLKLSAEFNCVVGIDNILNKEYSPHISRVRGVAGGVPNPGRSSYVNLKYVF